jgi:hypothetical protein
MTSNDNSKKKQRKGSNTSPMSYNDYSTANPESYMFAASNSGKGGVKIPFPIKLFQILEQIDIHNPELAPVVSWQPHGRSFRVHDLEKFKERILPEFFNDSQYTSFTRQLNLWRFKRMKGSGLDRSSYYHPMFLRDRPFLCNGMNRTALVGSSGKKKKRGVSSCLSDRIKNYEQPKFYSMEPMPPTTKKQINASNPAIEMNAFGLNSMPSCDSVSNDRRTSSFQSLEIPFYHVHHFPPSDTSMQKQDNSMYSRYCIDSKPSGISMDSQKDDDSFQNQDYRSMYKRGNSYEESMYDHSWSPITGVPPPLTKEEIRQIRDMCSRIK